MQITIEPTNEFTVVNGTKVRQWIGRTEQMVGVKVFVALIAVNAKEDQREFEHILRSIEPPPEAEHRIIPLRMIL